MVFESGKIELWCSIGAVGFESVETEESFLLEGFRTQISFSFRAVLPPTSQHPNNIIHMALASRNPIRRNTENLVLARKTPSFKAGALCSTELCLCKETHTHTYIQIHGYIYIFRVESIVWLVPVTKHELTTITCNYIWETHTNISLTKLDGLPS